LAFVLGPAPHRPSNPFDPLIERSGSVRIVASRPFRRAASARALSAAASTVGSPGIGIRTTGGDGGALLPPPNNPLIVISFVSRSDS
jgi:hypothetical protein